MPTNLPADTAVQMKFTYPSTCTGWDGPPAWTTSDPDHSIITLISEDQTQATITLAEGATGVTVTVGCPFCTGNSDTLDVQDGATSPGLPIDVTGTKTS